MQRDKSNTLRRGQEIPMPRNRAKEMHSSRLFFILKIVLQASGPKQSSVNFSNLSRTQKMSVRDIMRCSEKPPYWYPMADASLNQPGIKDTIITKLTKEYIPILKYFVHGIFPLPCCRPGINLNLGSAEVRGFALDYKVPI